MESLKVYFPKPAELIFIMLLNEYGRSIVHAFTGYFLPFKISKTEKSSRSSCPEVFCEKGIVKNVEISKNTYFVEHLPISLFEGDSSNILDFINKPGVSD